MLSRQPLEDLKLSVGRVQQMELLGAPTVHGLSGTFSPNRDVDLHRWYPYLEGFSEGFVRALLDEFGREAAVVHDPFAGTGTTPLVSAARGLRATYCEINPFMRLVIEAKTNTAHRVHSRLTEASEYLRQLLDLARDLDPTLEAARSEVALAFGDRVYFEGRRLREVVALRRAIGQLSADTDCTALARVALGAIIVDCSQLKRAGDVRYRRPKEMAQRIGSPFDAFSMKANQILDDIANLAASDTGKVEHIADSALDAITEQETDLVLTSPPYLNGTNYFRNTKLELWAAGLLSNESELGLFRTAAVAAGINNISRRGRTPEVLPYVESVAEVLDEVAYDRRIPELVRRYFSDAKTWLSHLQQMLRPGGKALVDIGDSKFAGVLVKTDALLSEVAVDVGFDVVEARVLRTRRSKDGSALEQTLLVLSRPGKWQPRQAPSVAVGFVSAAENFEKELPHTQPPLNARNWGHGWHSLCSYQGKLKPGIAHVLIREFTSPGDVVLDPMSGAGTIPLEACLQGRIGWGNDLQELGYILTRAKVGWGDAAEVDSVAEDLLVWVAERRALVDVSRYADFGMNGRLPEYFHTDTYREVLAAREYMSAHPADTWERSLVYASLLHVLHGNRPYALSRRSHPVTPFKPQGDFEYRPLAPRLRSKLARTLAAPRGEGAVTGRASNMDMFALPIDREADVVITSPPFAGSTRFSVANWMRLWMAGWEPDDFTQRREAFLEHQQRVTLDIYSKFFASASTWLKPGGRMIMHVGRNKKWNMAKELAPRADDWFELVHSFDECVVGRESFGISDQGSTSSHQYLFFVAR
jgi:DNA modification methylase